MPSVRQFNSVQIGLLAAVLGLTSHARLLAQTSLTLKDGTISVSGELAKDDANDTVRKHPSKTYAVKLKAGQTYEIDMVRKKQIDPYLRLEDSTGKELASDDDGGGFPNARIVFNCPKDGTFRIIATTFDGSLGTYTLTVKRVESVKAVALELKMGEATVNGDLTKDDPKDTGRRNHACKVYAVTLAAGKAYQIDMVSKKIDSYLRLEDATGKELARDDDSGGDRNARIVFKSPKDATYRIIATTFNGSLGKFQLTVNPKE